MESGKIMRAKDSMNREKMEISEEKFEGFCMLCCWTTAENKTRIPPVRFFIIPF